MHGTHVEHKNDVQLTTKYREKKLNESFRRAQKFQTCSRFSPLQGTVWNKQTEHMSLSAYYNEAQIIRADDGCDFEATFCLNAINPYKVYSVWRFPSN
jgi:hypothetical protein